LAYTLNVELKQPYRVAIVASVEDLGKKIGDAQRLSDPQRQQIKDRDGIYFFEQPLSQEGRLAFLFQVWVRRISTCCRIYACTSQRSGAASIWGSALYSS
jgi:hypothetical protein